MLNEWIELQQYTFAPECDDGIKPRLNHRNICNKLSGIERAMTVIARYCYYHHAPERPAAQRIALAEAVLKSWCGGESECPDGFTQLQNWLPRYIEQILLIQVADSPVSVSRLRKALTALQSKQTEFDRKFLLPYISDDEANRWINDYKKITYDSIIANAIAQGPLENRVMVCRGDLFRPIRKARGNLLASDRDRIQKLLAAFLLGRTNPDQEFAAINKTDIANWCEGDPKLDGDDYEKYLYGNEPLFVMKTLGSSVVKLRVAGGYLAESGLALYTERELADLDLTGCTVFEDKGAGSRFEAKEGELCYV